MNNVLTTIFAILFISFVDAYGQDFTVVQFTKHVDYKREGSSHWETINENGILLQSRDSIKVYSKSSVAIQKGKKTYTIGECYSTVGKETSSGATSFFDGIIYYLFGEDNAYIPFSVWKGEGIDAVLSIGKDESSLSASSAKIMGDSEFVFEVQNKDDKPICVAFFLVDTYDKTLVLSIEGQETAMQRCILIPPKATVQFTENAPFRKADYNLYAVYHFQPFSPVYCLIKRNGRLSLDYGSLSCSSKVKLQVTD